MQRSYYIRTNSEIGLDFAGFITWRGLDGLCAV